MSFGLGEAASLACALLWAVATISLKRAGETIPAFELNLCKNVGIALLLIPPILLFEANVFTDFTPRATLLLLLSGLIGVCLADWLLLASLQYLGAGRNAILDCLYSPFVILFAYLHLGEVLTLTLLLGAGLVVTGILAATLFDRRSDSVKDLPRGLACGIASMVAMAAGIVMAKPILENAPIYAASELRMLAGAGGGLLGIILTRKTRSFLAQLSSPAFPHLRIWVGVCLPAFFAMCLWILGYRLIDASTASILNQTSTFFILALAALFLGERLTAPKLLGALLAFAGIGVITFA